MVLCCGGVLVECDGVVLWYNDVVLWCVIVLCCGV